MKIESGYLARNKNDKWALIIRILLIPSVLLAILSGSFIGYGYASENNIKPQIVTEIVPVTVIERVPVEIVRVVKVPVEVEKVIIREVPVEVVKEVVKVVVKVVEVIPEMEGEFIPFKSTDAIREYVKSTGIPDRKYVTEEYDCEDFALDLFRQSYKDRREIGLFLVFNQNGRRLHMKNFAVRGSYIYEIEPQTGNVYPLAGYEARLD